MFVSLPICTIQDSMQMSAMKMAICYKYSTSGVQSNQAYVRFYGITKGVRTALAEATLDTDVDYVGNSLASCLIIKIPTNEFPYIQWELIIPSGSNFSRVCSEPQIILSVNSGTDFPNDILVKEATSL